MNNNADTDAETTNSTVAPLVINTPQDCLPALRPMTNAEYFAQHPEATYRMTISHGGVSFYVPNGRRWFFSLEVIRENAWWFARNQHRTAWKHLFNLWD